MDGARIQRQLAGEEAPEQLWLEQRLQGLCPADLRGNVRIYCTSDLQPPRSFQEMWRTYADDTAQASEPLLSEEDASELDTILVFCNQTKRQEVDRMLGLISSIDSQGIDAPPVFWVPHSVAPENREVELGDHVDIAIAKDALWHGVDGILAGEPEGFRLRIAVNVEIQKSVKMSQHIEIIVRQCRAREERVELLKSHMHSIMWDFVRNRLATEIPPVDHSFPPGPPRELPSHKVGDPSFRVGEILGKGSFGLVRSLIEDPDNGSPAQVVKIVSKAGVKHIRQVRNFDRMIRVMRILSTEPLWHPNIVCLCETYHTPTHILFRMESGGSESLFRRLCAREDSVQERARPLPLHRAMVIITQLIDAVQHIHDKAQVAHRDIKPENVMVNDSDGGAPTTIKVIDFDLAIITSDEEQHVCRSVCGTLPFAAPEVLIEERYFGFNVDIWGMGVLFLEILCGIRVVDKVIAASPPPPGVDGWQEIDHGTQTAIQMKTIFNKHLATIDILQERGRPELRALSDVFGPTLDAMLQVDPQRRATALVAKSSARDCFVQLVTPVQPSTSKPCSSRPKLREKFNTNDT